jgi:Tfp pilus assembly protein PilF
MKKRKTLLQIKTATLAWSGIVFGLIGALLALLTYTSHREEVIKNRDIEAKQYLYEAMELLGAEVRGPHSLEITISPRTPEIFRETKTRLENARRLIEKYSILKPDDTTAQSLIIVYHVLLQDIDGAKTSLQKLKTLDGEISDSDVYIFMGMIVGNTFKQTDRAKDYFQKAIELNPKSASAHGFFGAFLHTINENEHAIKMLEKGVLLEPKNTEMLNALGHVLYETGDTQGSIRVLEKAIQSGVADSETYNSLGGIYSQQERYNEAIVNLKKAIDLAPTEGIPWRNLFLVLKKTGRHKEAEEALEQAERYWDYPFPIQK